MYTFYTVSAKLYPDTNNKDSKKYNGQRSVCTLPGSEETIMGRKFLDSGLLCVDSERTWE